MSSKLLALGALLAATTATVAASAATTAASAKQPVAIHVNAGAPQARHVRITVNPRTVVPYGSAEIDVADLPDATSVEVRLDGASSVLGTPVPWIALHRESDGNWSAHLPQPVLPGIYPIELRTRPALAIAPTQAAYLRVYWQGTEARPLFSTPDQVAAWWVRHLAGGTLVAIRPWHRQAIDHRIASLHRLFVVAYSPPGMPEPSERLGVWITAVREGYGGDWRLLEATPTPP